MFNQNAPHLKVIIRKKFFNLVNSEFPDITDELKSSFVRHLIDKYLKLALQYKDKTKQNQFCSKVFNNELPEFEQILLNLGHEYNIEHLQEQIEFTNQNSVPESSTSSDLIAQNIEPITNASSSSNVFPACGVSIHHSIPVNIPINNNPPLAPVENFGNSISSNIENISTATEATTSLINTNYGAIAILAVWYGISFLIN